MSPPNGKMQGSVGADPGSHSHVCPGLEKDPRNLDVSASRGPVEGRHAVASGDVYVGTTLDQAPDRSDVTLFHRLDDGT